MSIKDLLKKGFCNTIFPNRKPKTIEEVVDRVVKSPQLILPDKLRDVKVEPINETSDKIILSFDDEEVQTTWVWRESSNGKYFVLNNIE